VKLTPEQRKQIDKQAVDRRWPLNLHDLSIERLCLLAYKSNPFVIFDHLEGWGVHERLHVAVMDC
jgi:hypothetical protein